MNNRLVLATVLATTLIAQLGMAQENPQGSFEGTYRASADRAHNLLDVAEEHPIAVGVEAAAIVSLYLPFSRWYATADTRAQYNIAKADYEAALIKKADLLNTAKRNLSTARGGDSAADIAREERRVNKLHAHFDAFQKDADLRAHVTTMGVDGDNFKNLLQQEQQKLAEMKRISGLDSVSKRQVLSRAQFDYKAAQREAKWLVKKDRNWLKDTKWEMEKSNLGLKVGHIFIAGLVIYFVGDKILTWSQEDGMPTSIGGEDAENMMDAIYAKFAPQQSNGVAQ